MQLKMWSYDIAREQSPSLEFLIRLAGMTQESGFNTLGLYLEHRYQYRSVPRHCGIGALDASTV
jgi:hypothetical protein